MLDHAEATVTAAGDRAPRPRSAARLGGPGTTRPGEPAATQRPPTTRSRPRPPARAEPPRHRRAPPRPRDQPAAGATAARRRTGESSTARAPRADCTRNGWSRSGQRSGPTCRAAPTTPAASPRSPAAAPRAAASPGAAAPVEPAPAPGGTKRVGVGQQVQRRAGHRRGGQHRGEQRQRVAAELAAESRSRSARASPGR